MREHERTQARTRTRTGTRASEITPSCQEETRKNERDLPWPCEAVRSPVVRAEKKRAIDMKDIRRMVNQKCIYRANFIWRLKGSPTSPCFINSLGPLSLTDYSFVDNTTPY